MLKLDDSINPKNCTNLNQNASLVLALGLIVFSLALLLTSNNDIAAGFKSTNNSTSNSINNGPMHITVRINPGASDSQSQHPLNSSTITVLVGSSVTWVNNDAHTHHIVSGDPNKGPSNEFYSPLFAEGKKYTVTLNNTGVFPYYDDLYKHIKGQIIVNPLTTQR
jgi:plastocyanin